MFNNLTQNKGLLALLGISLLLFLIVIIASLTSFLSPQSGNNDLSPTPTSVAGRKISEVQKTIIGQTTPSDIEKLPTLENKTTLSDGSVKYTLTSPLITRKNEVLVQDDKVVFERIMTPIKSTAPGYATISEYKNEYGQPQQTIRGSHFYGEFIETFIYADQGFALIGNPFTDEVFEIQTFSPTTVENYKQQYGQDINEEADSTIL